MLYLCGLLILRLCESLYALSSFRALSFYCQAYEQLGLSEVKRQAYDSVDHKFNDAIPSEKSVNKDNFFVELAPVFERNAR